MNLDNGIAVKKMKIEISEKCPTVISWNNKDGWTQREKVTYKSLRKHGFNHCLLLLVLLLLLDILT